jgi:UDP:flavonoid glycosyltransferase YjiC (YdhE family)
MAHILLITSGLTGILYASFEMVKTLEAAGHHVTYASPKAVGEKVCANHITYRQLPPTNFEPCPEVPNFRGKTRKLKRLIYKFRYAKRLRKEAVDALNMKQFRSILQDINPDLVLIDVELHEYLMTCVALDMPTILLSQWYSLWDRKGLPPLLEDTIPGEGFRGSQLGLHLAWRKIKLKRWWIFGKQKWRSAATDRRSILKQYAHQIGFPMQYATQNFWPGPFTYNTLPVFSMTLKEMEFPHDQQKELHYIGAQVYTDRKQTEIDQQMLHQFEAIFKLKREQNKSLIYCSVSTFKSGDQQFLQRVIEAVAGREDWLLVIGLGGLLDNTQFKDLPHNVFAFGWVPQLQVLAQADLSINHGGVHTINECIHFKVPMLVYSGKRSDQNGCAARVEYHRVGRMADKDNDDVSAIQKKIEQVLTNDSYQRRMEEMYDHYQAYKKHRVLVQKIDDYLVSFVTE